MPDDLDQAVLLIAAVMVPLCLLPFLLARIETWLAAPQRTGTAKPHPKAAQQGVRGPDLGPARARAGTQTGWARVRQTVASTALWWRRGASHPRPERRR